MPIARRTAVVLPLLFGCGPAFASDVSGLPTMLMGIPTLSVLSLSLGACLAIRGAGARKVAAIIGALVVVASFALFGEDALGTFFNGQEALLGAVFLGLACLALYLCFKLFSTQRAHATDGR